MPLGKTSPAAFNESSRSDWLWSIPGPTTCTDNVFHLIQSYSQPRRRCTPAVPAPLVIKWPKKFAGHTQMSLHRLLCLLVSLSSWEEGPRCALQWFTWMTTEIILIFTKQHWLHPELCGCVYEQGLILLMFNINLMQRSSSIHLKVRWMFWLAITFSEWFASKGNVGLAYLKMFFWKNAPFRTTLSKLMPPLYFYNT